MHRHFLSTFALLALLVPAASSASTMKQTGVVVEPLPGDGAVVAFDDLVYGPESTRREITSVRLEIEPDDDDGKIVTVWTFTGNNVNANLQRVDLSVSLLDEGGRRIATSSKRMVLRRGARGQTQALKLKLSRGEWQAAKKAKIEASFVTL